MIQETCLEIDELAERHETERLQRYARRNRIREIDELLNEFELLNLAEEGEVPQDLTGRVWQFIEGESHPIARRPVQDVRITEWMDALYDVQDTLMLSVDDDID
jgi:hypothetical protein